MRAPVRTLLLLLPFLSGCDDLFKPDFAVEEASGITRLGKHLLIVGDGASDGYYTYPVPDSGVVIPVLPDRLSWVGWRRTGSATDCESIDVLADGRVVILSEDLRALIGEKGVVARYGEEFRERAKRGLEGVAVRRLPDGSSRVAVVWEGGVPSNSAIPMSGEVWPPFWSPRVLVHDLKRGQAGVLATGPAVRVFVLDVHAIPGVQSRNLQLRAPDLVWHRDEKGGPLLIVLLSQKGRQGQRDFHWLQRFDLEGRPVGSPAEFKQHFPERLRDNTNWEGLGWFEEGRRLVTIHDQPPQGHPTACLIDLPEGW